MDPFTLKIIKKEHILFDNLYGFPKSNENQLYTNYKLKAAHTPIQVACFFLIRLKFIFNNEKLILIGCSIRSKKWKKIYCE